MVSSCIKEKFIDDSFTIKKSQYNGQELNIKGYYYYKNFDGSNNLFVLYSDGTVLLLGNPSDSLDKYVQMFVKEFNHGIQTFWGVFIINDTSIKIEYLMPRMIEGRPAYIKNGTILNDTTFIMKERYRSKDGSEYQEIEEIYHFRNFSPKPDSTNSYVK